MGIIDLTTDYKKEHRTVINDFIKTKVMESGARGVVLGLSGGLDSAVTAVLAAESLGNNNVHCIIMPYHDELDRETVEHAVELAKKFKPGYEIIPIREQADKIVENLSWQSKTMKSGLEKLHLTAAGNVKARIRMITLYYYANLHNYLVLGTSNKSELLIGYFTKFGDGGNDAMPIGDLYKTQVYQLAEELGIPENIRKKPPTAGLFSGQSDEKDIGLKYSELDQILRGIELRLGSDDISELTGIDLKTVKSIRKKVLLNSHKRCLGRIPKLGTRTIGFDWRENVSLVSLSHDTTEE